jgi:prepilin-type N-terminal cleavage/methylation domain-containing protein
MKTNIIHLRQQRTGGKGHPAALARGFTLLELMVVAAIAAILIAVAVPNLINTITLAKLRGGMSELSGIMQNCRSQAIKGNATKHLIFTSSQGIWGAYVDDLASPQGLTAIPPPPQAWLPSQYSKVAAPVATSTNPTPLTGAMMWGPSTTWVNPDTTDDMCFNSRGIPCVCPASSPAFCSGITNGYAFYFTQGTQWAALAVSPAGRIKTYFWNGGAWSN